MVKLSGERIYLSVLEKEDCIKLWNDFEYDFEAVTEPLNIGHSVSKAEGWFDDIQREQGERHIRLGIFLNDNTIIGDIALQDIDWKNRSCSLGIGIAKKEYRSKGYGKEAIDIMLAYGFKHLGLERITAHTLEQNIAAQRALETLTFSLEGRERKAVYFAARKWDRLNYAILIEDYNKGDIQIDRQRENEHSTRFTCKYRTKTRPKNR
ncbi:MAG: GNAT family N-acetyltransferase [Bacillaceae bacterium]|nr:GNAT family N-acetyltransferase [Bacillaceae bacterium]